MADLPVPAGASGRGHISSASIVLGKYILVLGGETVHATSYTSMVSAYTPDNNVWKNLTPLPQSRYSGVAANLDGIIYYSGGSSSKVTYKGTPASQKADTIIYPVADAFVRNGTYANVNYGNSSTLEIKGSSTSGFVRSTYLKFPLNNISGVSTAKLRFYGSNTTDNTTVNVSVYGVSDDSWLENGIVWNNAPAASTAVLCSVPITSAAMYYEADVTDFVLAQFNGDKTAGFLITDPSNTLKNIILNSKENSQNSPQLVINNSGNGINTVLNIADNLSNQRNYFTTKTETKIFPDPVHDKLIIKLANKNDKVVEVQIIDVIGRTYNLGYRKLFQGNNNIEIDISTLSLPKGIYYLYLNTDAKQAEVHKFLIQ